MNHRFHDPAIGALAQLAASLDAQMMASSATQPAPSTQATNPQPQTTGKAPGTFWQNSFPGNAPEYVTSFAGTTGVASGGWGTQITTALVPVSGYFRRFRVTVTATGGTGTTTITATAADAPWNCVQQVIVKDASGNVNIENLPGWEALRLVPIMSGSYGLENFLDPGRHPFYSGISTATATGNGNFQFQSWLPLEFGREGVGCIGGDNASVLPTIFWTTNTLGTVYPFFATGLSTPPTLNLQVDADFWWNPDAADVVPDGLGSSRQYNLLPCTPTVQTGSAAIVTVPKFGGGFVDSVAIECRDSILARTDTAWPIRFQFIVDNVTYINEAIDQVIEDMYVNLQFFSNADPYYATGQAETIGARPKGVLIFSFRAGLSQLDTGILQSGENYISTTPGTNIQFNGTGWRNQFSDASAPYTIYVVLGLVVPAGTLVTA